MKFKKSKIMLGFEPATCEYKGVITKNIWTECTNFSKRQIFVVFG